VRNDLRQRTSAKELKPRINTNEHEQPPNRNRGLTLINADPCERLKQLPELIQTDEQFEQFQSEIERIPDVKE
jgi:hypothetical protein